MKAYKTKSFFFFELCYGMDHRLRTKLVWVLILSPNTYSTMSFVRFHLLNKASVSHLKSGNSNNSHLLGFKGK